MNKWSVITLKAAIYVKRYKKCYESSQLARSIEGCGAIRKKIEPNF